MRLYLLSYDRSQRRLVDIQEFEPGAYAEANRQMLEGELANPGWEVVLLEAPSRDALERTHARYFMTDVRSSLRPRSVAG